MLFLERGLEVNEASTHAAVEAGPCEVLTGVGAITGDATAGGEATFALGLGGLLADGWQVDGGAQDVDHLEMAGEAVTFGLVASQ